jgi:hypothetical protein
MLLGKLRELEEQEKKLEIEEMQLNQEEQLFELER